MGTVDSRFLPIIEVARGLSGAVVPARAPAKVNLRLKVTGRRSDGYHLLSMLNVNVDLADELGVRFTETGVDIVSEPAGVSVGPVEQNLITRAFRAFWRQFGLEAPPFGLACHVTKRIPIGAGLGGGSSDAGALLRVLVATCGKVLSEQLGVSPGEVVQRAVQAGLECGADVPYAFSGGLAWVSGIGERIQSLKPSGPWRGKLLLMMPQESVSTALFYKAFRELHPHLEAPLDTRMVEVESAGELSFSGIPELVENDFERCVVALAPSVGRGLEVARRYFPIGSGVTGSGSAFFSVIPEAEQGKVVELEQEISSLGIRVKLCSFEPL